MSDNVNGLKTDQSYVVDCWNTWLAKINNIKYQASHLNTDLYAMLRYQWY